MDRRDFIRILAGSTLGLATHFRSASASTPANAAGPLFFGIHAAGGWDPTIICDPVTARFDDFVEYGPSHVMTAAGTSIRYAPRRVDGEGNVLPYLVPNGSQGEIPFFEKYGPQILVINGINCETVSHRIGVRNTWTGSVREGRPSIAALSAAVHGPDLPLTYISSARAATADLVSLTRSGNPEALKAVLRSYQSRRPQELEPLVPTAAQSHLRLAESARRLRRQNAESLPEVQAMLERLGNLRRAEGGLSTLLAALNELPTLGVPRPPDSNPLVEQVEMTVAGMKCGFTSSALLAHPEFDTHRAHFATGAAPDLVSNVLAGFDYGLSLLEAWGLGSRVVAMMGSDFGRTALNRDAGKDHRPVGSIMLLGRHIQGGRVIGATTVDEDEKGATALALDPETLEVSGDPDAIQLRVPDIHAALRTVLEVENTEPAERFPLEGRRLPIFTPI